MASVRNPFGHLWVLLSSKEGLDAAEIERLAENDLFAHGGRDIRRDLGHALERWRFAFRAHIERRNMEVPYAAVPIRFDIIQK